MSFDVIGDIHGEYDKLIALLSKLGYRDTGGSWRHPSHTAIFVGDLIDRGAKQAATVDLVRSMVDAGRARCILGNHEFNAIAWATPDPARKGSFLRRHSKRGNHNQHAAFLKDVGSGSARHQEYVNWFKTLPLWLDVGGLRVVHACWDQRSMDMLLSRGLPGDLTLTDSLVVQGSDRRSEVYSAIEILCKGPEARLPNGLVFHDKEGKERHEVRIKWWGGDMTSFRRAANATGEFAATIPDVPLDEPWRSFTYTGPPVIFGHYWFRGQPKVISPRFACIDYSVAKGGPLVAYRWDGEPELRNEQVVSV